MVVFFIIKNQGMVTVARGKVSNLTPFNKMSEEKKREIQSKGGKASQAKAAERRTLAKCADIFLSTKVDKQTEKYLKDMGISNDDITKGMHLIAKLYETAAIEGNVPAIRLLYEMQRDMNEQNSSQSVYDSGLFYRNIAPVFDKVWRQVESGTVHEIVLKGGRGSTKSSFAGMQLLKLLNEHPDCHAVVLRKYSNTLRTSVYAQMQWALGAMGLEQEYKCTVSPMEFTNKRTGQKILFFGLDDPAKLKSIKPAFGYIGVLWFEELDQYAGEAEIRNVEQSCLRGGQFSFTIKTFNPPSAQRNWANRYALEEKNGKLVHHSTYLDVPSDWLGKRFWDDAEHLKETNEAAYRHEYLGEVTGSGRAVFENIRYEHITDEQIKGFERVWHGIDWGWYPDPFAFNSVYYHNKKLYIFDELTRRRTSNEDTFKLLKEKHILENKSEILTADSAEPKSCADFTRWGLKCLPAIKGAGSVQTGMKWLQSLDAIIIDPARCPDTAKELGEYEYDIDRKTGEVLEGYPDHDNHHCDCIRYATESIWRKPAAKK